MFGPAASSANLPAPQLAALGELRRGVTAFLRHPDPEGFAPLALAAARAQAAAIPAYQRICALRRVDLTHCHDWRAIPPVPTLAFKRQALCVEPAALVFRSSGTQATGRSEHHQPWPELYDLAVDESFPAACLPTATPVPMLSLIPTPALIPDSSLAHMVARIVASWGSESSTSAFDGDGLDPQRARQWLQRAGATTQPVLVLTTAFALVQLLDAAQASSWQCSLPRGSVLFETGGYKGRSRELRRADLEAAVEQTLGIASSRIVREYGMSELSSQLYASTLSGGSNDRFRAPAWVRIQVLDPVSLEPLPAGAEGLISVLDLANAGSVLHVLTEDLGRLDDTGGLELLGRASSAELRGCSLTAEAMGSTTTAPGG